MNIVAIIQGRTGSTRFRNKIFAELVDKPLIWHIVKRLKFSKTISKIVLATTVNEDDDVMIEWARNENILVFRGSEDDVLSRFYEAAKLYKADIIVRVTADDPFKDPEIIDRVVEILLDKALLFSYNNFPPSFPEGLDTEVFTFAALEQAHSCAVDPFEREHVTQYFYRNPSLFKQFNYSNEVDISDLRWTIDTKKDYEMAREVYKHLYKEEKIFLTKDILDLLQKNPEISAINNTVKRSDMYNKI